MSDVATVQSLSKLLNDEILKAMGLGIESRLGSRLRPLFARGTARFCELMAEVDRIAGERGLAAAASSMLARLVSGVEIYGAERIPLEGPLVVASNHPGTVDSVVIAAGMHRADLRVIASGVPFLRALPNISKSMIFTPPRDMHARMHVVREALGHLRSGGTLLVFGRGQIDPDPAFMPDAEKLLGAWSRSLEIFLDRIPEARVLVTIVSGVLDPKYMRHPLTWFRRTREDRQRLAMMAQMIQQMLGKRLALRPRITFGDLVSEQSAGGKADVLPAIIGVARRLLPTHVRG